MMRVIYNKLYPTSGFYALVSMATGKQLGVLLLRDKLSEKVSRI